MQYGRMLEIVRPGERVANGIQGGISPSRWNSFKEKMEEKGKEPLAEMKRVFQRGMQVQRIAVPGISSLLFTLETENPLVYKGVSYNPYTTSLGENANLLDFYSYMQRANFPGIIINASGYAVVNANALSPVAIYSKNAAKEAVSALSLWFEASEETKASSEIRAKYLEAISLALMPQKSKPIVIDAPQMWKSPQYQKSLQEAIEFCSGCNVEGEGLEIRRYANYNRYDTPFQRWYSVLVLAEAIYLRDVFGANIKLGPTSESNFDDLIKESMSERRSPFSFIWYDRTVEKVVSIDKRISFNDSPGEIREKIRREPALADWMRELVEPFYPKPKDLAGAVAKIVREVNKVAEKVRIPPLFEGGFFVAFPPGECD